MNAVRRMNPIRTVVFSLVIVLTLVLAAELVWAVFIAPRMTIGKVVFDSDLNISDAQLLEMLDLSGDTWASIEENELSERLESYPVVRKAQVVKVFPDTLRLFVYRRRPLVVALVNSSGTTIPAVFDEEGYAIQVGGSSGGLNLPVISGPRFPEPALGARLPEGMNSVLSDLSYLREDDPRMFELISEIEMIPRGEEAFDLRLYMNHVPIPVLIDRTLDAEAVKRAVLVLDVLATGSVGDVNEADIRGGHVVFRRSEES